MIYNVTMSEIILYNTAKLAKEKNFNWDCRFLYKSNIGWEEGVGVDYNWNKFDSISAPTQTLLQKWLREIHNIDVIPNRQNNNIQYFVYVWFKHNDPICLHESMNCRTYEEAFEIGLQYALNKI